jgi:hypothetical protein
MNKSLLRRFHLLSLSAILDCDTDQVNKFPGDLIGKLSLHQDLADGRQINESGRILLTARAIYS